MGHSAIAAGGVHHLLLKSDLCQRIRPRVVLVFHRLQLGVQLVQAARPTMGLAHEAGQATREHVEHGDERGGSEDTVLATVLAAIAFKPKAAFFGFETF